MQTRIRKPQQDVVQVRRQVTQTGFLPVDQNNQDVLNNGKKPSGLIARVKATAQALIQPDQSRKLSRNVSIGLLEALFKSHLGSQQRADRELHMAAAALARFVVGHLEGRQRRDLIRDAQTAGFTHCMDILMPPPPPKPLRR